QKSLVELSRDPIFIWDFDDGIVEWNRGCEELFGFSREEALGKLKEQLLSTSGTDFSFADVRATLLAGGSWSGELTQKTKDGRLLTVESRVQLEAFDSHRLVLESIHDITERKEWERRQNLLLGELSHRVKNTMAVVQAIAHQTLRGTGSTEEFAQRFDGRLMALSEAHNLLVESNWERADFSGRAGVQVQALIPARPARLILAGEPVLLPADIATPFGLVLHELAANAARYGSLVRPSGMVKLSWIVTRRNNRRVLRVSWQEKGGPRAQPPAATGFGSTLIQTAIPDAEVRREFRDDGLLCTIELSLPRAKGNGADEQT